MKRWTGLLKQNGESAPTAAVLENSLGGNIAWSRISQGYYAGTFPAPFDPAKTLVKPSQTTDYDTDSQIGIFCQTGTGTTFTISVTFGGSLSDDELSGTPLEILVYD